MYICDTTMHLLFPSVSIKTTGALPPVLHSKQTAKTVTHYTVHKLSGESALCMAVYMCFSLQIAVAECCVCCLCGAHAQSPNGHCAFSSGRRVCAALRCEKQTRWTKTMMRNNEGVRAPVCLICPERAIQRRGAPLFAVR